MHTDTRDSDDVRRANPLGAYLAALGAVIVLVSVWLNWMTMGPGDSERNPSSGYEADGVIPLLGYLALGFAIALLYATKRADRRQHRGLSLASFAVGLASLLWAISYIIDPISTTQYNEGVSTEIGPWIAAIGSLLWTLGSFLLAKEPEGDRETDGYRVAHTVAPVATTHRTQEVHRTTGVATDTAYDTHAHDPHTHGHDTHGTIGEDRDFGATDRGQRL